MSGFSEVDYGALDIDGVTSNAVNADILRKLKNDDRPLTYLSVGGRTGAFRNHFAIEDARGMGVLGHYLGRSATMSDLYISLPIGCGTEIIELFLLGLKMNRSIKRVYLLKSELPRDFFRIFTPFIRDLSSLRSFHVEGCPMDVEQYRSLSSALREGRSLTEFRVGGLVEGGRHDDEESIIANIEALKMHPQLEVLRLRRFALGRNACLALSDLLRQSDGMEHLHLDDNHIDDSGLEALADGLAHSRGVQELNFSGNPATTARGWRALATLLEDPDCNLQELNLYGCGVDDESAIMFANALAHNNTLTALYLDSEDVENTGEGWKEAFSKVLCDTSSVNNTFLSNHTLYFLSGPGEDEDGDEGGDEDRDNLPDDLISLLGLNQDEDKKAVAYRKILLHHDDFDMQPLLEWDLKVLPFVIKWFESAAGGYGILQISDLLRPRFSRFQFSNLFWLGSLLSHSSRVARATASFWRGSSGTMRACEGKRDG